MTEKLNDSRKPLAGVAANAKMGARSCRDEGKKFLK